VYGIVRQTGGHVTIDSEPGRGTVFNVFFPATDAPAEATRPDTGQTVEVLTGSETILLAEDDAAIRALARRVLEGYGYTVYDAGSAQEAIALVAQARPRLLVTDLMLPETSGIELARQLVQRLPGLRVVCMSGYSGDDLPARDVPAGWFFLQKPFTPETIARRVRVALDSPAD
jgi:CheY-like chemotaxis protein